MIECDFELRDHAHNRWVKQTKSEIKQTQLRIRALHIKENDRLVMQIEGNHEHERQIMKFRDHLALYKNVGLDDDNGSHDIQNNISSLRLDVERANDNEGLDDKELYDKYLYDNGGSYDNDGFEEEQYWW